MFAAIPSISLYFLTNCVSPGEPALTALCYCSDCQKLTGSAFSSNVAVHTTSFSVTTGVVPNQDAVGTCVWEGTSTLLLRRQAPVHLSTFN